MRLPVSSSFRTAAFAAVALFAMLPSHAQGQSAKISDPFNWLDRYDSTQMITLTGVISKVDWTNPHIYISLDVKDASGKVTAWQVEGYPPNTLKRAGFPREDLREGDTLTITAFRAKDGSNAGAGSEVTLPGGTKKRVGPTTVLVGTSAFQGR